MQHLPLPLKRRTFKSYSVVPNLYTYPLNDSIRDGPRKQWTDEAMDRAINAVEQQGITIRKAAEMYQIPRSTFHDHLTGKVEHESLPGPKRYLSMEEEEIVSFLIRCAKIGYPHIRHQVMGLVQKIISSKDIQTVLSDGWWERFKKRHPSITLREAASLSYARAMASDQECLESYFDLLFGRSMECLMIHQDYSIVTKQACHYVPLLQKLLMQWVPKIPVILQVEQKHKLLF